MLNVSPSSVKPYYAPEQSPLQKRLHIPTAINNQKNVHSLAHNPVNDTVGFKENLAVFSESQEQASPWDLANASRLVHRRIDTYDRMKSAKKRVSRTEALKNCCRTSWLSAMFGMVISHPFQENLFDVLS